MASPPPPARRHDRCSSEMTPCACWMRTASSSANTGLWRSSSPLDVAWKACRVKASTMLARRLLETASKGALSMARANMRWRCDSDVWYMREMPESELMTKKRRDPLSATVCGSSNVEWSLASTSCETLRRSCTSLHVFLVLLRASISVESSRRLAGVALRRARISPSSALTRCMPALTSSCVLRHLVKSSGFSALTTWCSSCSSSPCLVMPKLMTLSRVAISGVRSALPSWQQM
mmetsp:Transcript_360/g.749  ORF Transcript_360/g.749 Transcript_360/m.749 type:complete len:235 (-) Transcript_360:494-1198(-)